MLLKLSFLSFRSKVTNLIYRNLILNTLGCIPRKSVFQKGEPTYDLFQLIQLAILFSLENIFGEGHKLLDCDVFPRKVKSSKMFSLKIVAKI